MVSRCQFLGRRSCLISDSPSVQLSEHKEPECTENHFLVDEREIPLVSARRRGCIFLKRCLKENRSALPLLRKHSDAIALTWALSFSTAASTTNPLRARPAPSENQHTLVTTAQIRKPGPVYSFARYTKEASDDCFPRRQHKLFRMLKVTPITQLDITSQRNLTQLYQL